MVNSKALQHGSDDCRVHGFSIICCSKINKMLNKMRMLDIMISVQNFSIVVNGM